MPRSSIPPWVSLPGHPLLKGRAGHTGTLVGKKLYVIGGRNGSEFFNDLWEFDTELLKWSLLQKHTPFEARAYHTATLMNGNQLWIIGGSGHVSMYGDVHVLNLETLEWSSPQTRGQLAGKPRGTHSAIQHPVQEKSILLFGGYGGSGPTHQWLSDLSILRTDTLLWEEVKCKGVAPCGRGYHTFTPFGIHVVLYGGKGETGIVSSDEISVYDAAVNVWMTPRVRGVAPLSRSNHAATQLKDDLLVIYGGRNGGSRLDDISLLRILFPPQAGCIDSFEWDVIEQPENSKRSKKSGASKGPGGRSALTVVTKDLSLYLFGGYGGGGVTHSDIFVIHDFLKAADSLKATAPGQKPTSTARTRGARKSVRRSLENVPDSPEQEGWRSTKQPRRASHPTTKVAPTTQLHILDSDGNTTPDSTGGQPVVAAPALDEDCRQRRNTANTLARPQTNNTVDAEQIARTDAYKSLQERTHAVTAHENELHRKELASMQQVVDSLKAEIHGKNLLESELRSGKAALEQNIQLLKKQVEESNRITIEHQNKMERLKSDAQDIISQLDEKKKENFEVAHKLQNSEVKVDELSRSLQQMTNSYSSTTHELNKSKFRVEQLQMDAERKLQEVQLLHQTHESEKAVLTKELAEKSGQLERLSTELESSKTSARALQETVERLVKRAERDSAKIDKLQNERGGLKGDILALTSERDQLIAAKDGVEANAELVKEELRVTRSLVERNTVEIGRLKENADQAKEHIGCLHLSLKKNEDELKILAEENTQLRTLLKEIEDFETNHARSLQQHAEKLRCTRQFGPPS